MIQLEDLRPNAENLRPILIHAVPTVFSSASSSSSAIVVCVRGMLCSRMSDDPWPPYWSTLAAVVLVTAALALNAYGLIG